MSKTLIIPEMQILYRMCGLENDQAARKFYKPYKYLMHIHKQLTKKNIYLLNKLYKESVYKLYKSDLNGATIDHYTWSVQAPHCHNGTWHLKNKIFECI